MYGFLEFCRFDMVEGGAGRGACLDGETEAGEGRSAGA